MSDIDSMPAGCEMDALVAEKVMGWERTTTPTPEGDGLYWLREPGGMRRDYCIDEPGWSDQLPHYSTDIAAAWEVLEKVSVTTKPTPVTLTLLAHPSPWEFWIGNHAARAKTAPLAICRAALKVALS